MRFAAQGRSFRIRIRSGSGAETEVSLAAGREPDHAGVDKAEDGIAPLAGQCFRSYTARQDSSDLRHLDHELSFYQLLQMLLSKYPS
jgi:hypothetical protein